MGTGAGGKEEGRSYIEQCSPFSSLVGDGRQGQEGEAGGRQGEGEGRQGSYACRRWIGYSLCAETIALSAINKLCIKGAPWPHCWP